MFQKLLAGLTMLICVASANSATLYVPAQYSTIQAGIDAASNNDTVLVADGIYTGSGNKNLDFNGKAITVKSENGPENCVIDCENNGRGFYFHNYESNTSVLDGFTIQNGKVANDTGGGIKVKESGPVIRNNIIQNNKVIENIGGGGGIFCGSTWERPLVIKSNIIRNNESDQGGGISLSSSSPTIVNNLIIDNVANSGGGVSCKVTSTPQIINNTIVGNLAGDYGGGIYIAQGSSHPVIANTILWGNISAHGGDEIYLHPGDDVPCFVTLSYTDIEGGLAGIGCGNIHRKNIIWLEGNIDADPLFGNPSSELEYDLSPGSPCINAGTLENASTTDIVGRIRPQGSGIDMGAYEQNDDASLNVELSLFTASASSDLVMLKWRTESEVNNIGFNVYRDGQKIGFVPGAGNSGMPTDYQFQDNKIEPGKTHFYYLESIDIFGQRDKSKIIKINLPKAEPLPKKFLLLQNYPNPFNPETWIPYQLAKDSEVKISIRNVLGQIVWGMSEDKKTGYHEEHLSSRNLASGVYFYTLQAGEFTATRKMVIL
ncbi:MAG: T9SS type A sorting domain-containing protein, partial [bacterium]